MRLALVTVLVCLAARSAGAGQSIEHLANGNPEQLILLSRADVVIATVTEVSSHTPTNGDPPTGRIEVHEVLRGDAVAGPRRVLFAPYPHDIDTEGPGTQAELAAWGKLPMRQPTRLPAAGEQWVLIGWHEGDVFRVSWGGMMPLTDETRARAVARIREAAESLARVLAERAYWKDAEEARRTAWETEARARADVPGWTAEADFVGVGRIDALLGHFDGPYDFEITRILAGQKLAVPYPGDRYWTKVPVWKGAWEQIAGYRDYLLFLRVVTEERDGRKVSRHVLLGDRRGILRAEPSLVKEVEEALAAKKK